jgi:anti-anti-sigma factor
MVEVVLDVLPDRTPEPDEVEELVEVLVREHAASRVVVDLSRLDLIDSCLTARLVSMNKLVRSSGGRLVLCGLCPIVREILEQFRLDRVFEIVDAEDPELAMA